MDEELEGLELDVLRRQALNTITPKVFLFFSIFSVKHVVC